MAEIAVAATAPFGADVLERLAAEQDIAYVLTRPDRPQGRGRKVAPPPAKLKAGELGLPVRQPNRLDEFDPEVPTVVAIAYGLLIPAPLLERALWLNVHPSLLPKWRGAAPVERSLMAGEDETGVSIIKLVEELDAGPVAEQESFAISAEDDAGALYARAAEVATRLLSDVLEHEPEFREQEGEATYAAKIGPADREVDLTRPQDAFNRIRALSPHIGARAELHGRPVTIWRARLDDGTLVPLDVQPDGRRRMTYEEFLRGLR
jgi:methionyl-tRNA formyltransferase